MSVLRDGVGSRTLFWTVCAGAAALIWLPLRPPMIDLPQHAAQVAMLLRWNDPDWAYRSLFELHLFTPYLLAQGLVWLLAHVVSLDAALRIVISGSVVALPAAFSLVRRDLGGEPAWDWLVLPMAFGLAFWWGFLPFLVAAPIVFVALWAVARWTRAPDPRGGVQLAGVLTLAFFAHVLVFAYACAIGAAWSASHARGLRELPARLWPFVAPAPVALAWVALAAGAEDQADGTVAMKVTWERLILFSTDALGVSVSPAVFFGGLALYALPLLAGARPAADRRRWLLPAVAWAFFFFVPDYVMGSYCTARRFAMFNLPLFLLALDPPAAPQAWLPRAGRVAIVAAGLAAVANVGAIVGRWSVESASFEPVLAEMAPGRRVLNLVVDSDAAGIPMAYMHLPAWYAAEAGGVVDYSFAADYPQIVRYRPEARPALEQPTPARSFRWNRHQGWTWDYFVARGDVSEAFAGASCPVTLVVESGGWALYERDRSCLEER